MKVPEPRKLKSGLYFIQLRLGGVSVPVTASTAKECKRTAAQIKAEHQAGARVVTPVSDITLGQLIDRYIENSPALAPSTLRGYDIMRRHRFQAYMDKPVKKIKWQEMLNAEIEICSPKTIKNAWALVRRAMRKELKQIIPDTEYSIPQVPIKHLPYLRHDEIKPFCAALEGDSAEIPILLELHGLRRSEVLALTWEENIDLRHGMINVCGALVQDKNSVFVRKQTNKNKTSTRPVPIMIPRLRQLLEQVPDKTGRVVSINPDTMLEHISKACQRAGVTVVTNHGLRYSFASLGYHLGLSERQLMEMGGWADFETMHKIYIRISQEDMNRAKNVISTFFSGENANENANGSEKPA